MFGLSKKFTLVFVCFFFLFVVYPEVDIFVSDIFYSPKYGWFLAENFIVLFFYKSVNILSILLPLAYLTHLLISYFKKDDFLGIKKKTVAFLLITLLLGPGIVVSSIFKETVGRARPYKIEQLGGDKTFTPAFVVSNQCHDNCSFVSGHASFGFYFVVFSFLFTGERRRKLFKYGFTYGALVGLGRIIQGRHFFSDTIFAFMFVYITIYVIHTIMYQKKDEKPVLKPANAD